jgi:hypothetical protein
VALGAFQMTFILDSEGLSHLSMYTYTLFAHSKPVLKWLPSYARWSSKQKRIVGEDWKQRSFEKSGNEMFLGPLVESGAKGTAQRGFLWLWAQTKLLWGSGDQVSSDPYPASSPCHDCPVSISHGAWQMGQEQSLSEIAHAGVGQAGQKWAEATGEHSWPSSLWELVKSPGGLLNISKGFIPVCTDSKKQSGHQKPPSQEPPAGH